MPLFSTVLLKQMKYKLWVPLGFVNGLTIDVLGNSKACVGATSETEMDRATCQTHTSSFKFDDVPTILT